MTVELFKHQVPPDGDWDRWIICNGRGAGKTFALAHYMNIVALNRPGSTMIIVGPSVYSVICECYDVIKGFEENISLSQENGNVFIKWKNGSKVFLFGLCDPKDEERVFKILSPNLIWAHDLEKWRDEHKSMWDIIDNKHAKIIADIIPVHTKIIDNIIKDSGTIVSIARTEDSEFINQEIEKPKTKAQTGKKQKYETISMFGET